MNYVEIGITMLGECYEKQIVESVSNQDWQ